jgi:hypothetical protein
MLAAFVLTTDRSKHPARDERAVTDIRHWHLLKRCGNAKLGMTFRRCAIYRTAKDSDFEKSQIGERFRAAEFSTMNGCS